MSKIKHTFNHYSCKFCGTKQSHDVEVDDDSGIEILPTPKDCALCGRKEMTAHIDVDIETTPSIEFFKITIGREGIKS